MANEQTTDQAEAAMPDWSAYRGVFIVVEQRDGAAKKVSWQLLGEGKKLADKLEAPLMALVIGEDVEHLAHEAVYYGADKVYLVRSAELQRLPNSALQPSLLEADRGSKARDRAVRRDSDGPRFGRRDCDASADGIDGRHDAARRGAAAVEAAAGQPAGFFREDDGHHSL